MSRKRFNKGNFKIKDINGYLGLVFFIFIIAIIIYKKCFTKTAPNPEEEQITETEKNKEEINKKTN